MVFVIQDVHQISVEWVDVLQKQIYTLRIIQSSRQKTQECTNSGGAV